MSFDLDGNRAEEIRVVAGGTLVLRIRASDPAGIDRIFVQCFQFSLAASTRAKIAVGETTIPPSDGVARDVFDVEVRFPETAALGKWGVKTIEFTNRRGYKRSFYRGQGKFDDIVIEVVPPPAQEDDLLQFNGVEIRPVRGLN
jgi:hypothetical protein